MGHHEHHEHHEHCDHEHEHCHEHTHECAGCEACKNLDPMQETVALMEYMVKHNTAHAAELAALGKKLEGLGCADAAEQVLAAVSEFEKGNLRLSAILATLK